LVVPGVVTQHATMKVQFVSVCHVDVLVLEHTPEEVSISAEIGHFSQA
jgi:hypothetical protein